ncbi:MAG: hypothetical protein IPL84_02660 [Chitinophagaceae bacterium]|nr:hypothetical protein [Chitinophagaceae bacterium]
MKKVILALAIVSVSFAACNNGEEKTETPVADSTPVVEAPAAPVVTDSTATATPDSAAAATPAPAAH